MLSELLFYCSTNQSFVTNYKLLAETLSYQGFDPAHILKLFLDKARADKDNSDTFPIVDNQGDTILTITAKGDISQDLALFVLLFVTRGTNWDKIQKKTEDQWVKVFNYKVSKYGILSKKPTGGYTRDSLTIARLASCVPHWVVFFYHNSVGRFMVDMSLLSQASGQQIPCCMQTNMFATLLPKTDTFDLYVPFCYLYSYLLDSVINPKVPHNHKHLVDNIKSFVDAARSSTFITHQFRLTCLQYFGLMNTESTDFNPSVKAICSVAGNLWYIISSSSDRTASLKALESFAKTNAPRPLSTKTSSGKKKKPDRGQKIASPPQSEKEESSEGDDETDTDVYKVSSVHSSADTFVYHGGEDDTRSAEDTTTGGVGLSGPGATLDEESDKAHGQGTSTVKSPSEKKSKGKKANKTITTQDGITITMSTALHTYITPKGASGSMNLTEFTNRLKTILKDNFKLCTNELEEALKKELSSLIQAIGRFQNTPGKDRGCNICSSGLSGKH